MTSHVCDFCRKEYKSLAWFNKHMQSSHDFVRKAEPEPVEEVKAITQPIIVVEEVIKPKPTNIGTEIFNECTFIYTKAAEKSVVAAGNTYISPQGEAIKKSGNDDILIKREKAGHYGKSYSSYGSIPFNKLLDMWTQNNHLYEIIKDNHKPYFDIEFVYTNSAECDAIFENVKTVIVQCFDALDIKINPAADFSICHGYGIGETGTFAGINKASYHIIVNCGYKFINPDDSKKFIKFIEETIYKSGETFKNLVDNKGLAFDTAVYTKNRCFKLPYQTKVGSTRALLPMAGYERATLTDYLISYQIDDYKPIKVDNIKLDIAERIKMIVKTAKVSASPANLSIIEDYLSAVGTLPTDRQKIIITGEISQKIEYLLASIHNFGNKYKLWAAVGSAVKRCLKNDKTKALEIFTKWTNTVKNYTAAEISPYFDKFADNRYGFSTLLTLARVCNDKLDEYLTAPHKTLFRVDMPSPTIPHVTVNKRFIDFSDIYGSNNYIVPSDLETITQQTTNTITTYFNPIKNKYETKHVEKRRKIDTVFIKSPMGTGKSYSFKDYINQAIAKNENCNIIYLSSKRAFAESMHQEFSDIQFTNYMKEDVATKKRIIISIESLKKLSEHQLHGTNILIIDEAESIFNIISSETLIKNDIIANLTALDKLLKNSDIVFCMDAFLSNRSVEAVMNCRNPDTTIYYENTFKYEQRKYYELSKITLITDIKEKIKLGRRVCVVCGSKNYGNQILENLKDITDLKYQYYNSQNTLSLNTVVNNEWAEIQLLMYSPTITCGISYNNDEAKYDNLFIYAVNKGSTHFRDIIQASRRIRQFTCDTIGICLNDDFQGFNKAMQPYFRGEIYDLLFDYKKQLFLSHTPESIQNTVDLEWVFNIHCHNILEKNIHELYFRQVAESYFQLENIVKIEAAPLDNMTILDRVVEDWRCDAIADISKADFIEIHAKIKACKYINDNEYKQYMKYVFACRSKNGIDSQLFDDWHTEQGRPYVDNIKHFKEMIFKGFDTWKTKNTQVDKIEFYSKKLLAYEHIKFIMDNIKLIENGKLNIKKTFTTEDFIPIVEKYKTIDIKAINQLFDGIHTLRNDKKTEFTTKTAHSIFNKLLKSWFDYEIKNVKTTSKRINGQVKDITEYVIVPKSNKKCLFQGFKDDWTKILGDKVIYSLD